MYIPKITNSSYDGEKICLIDETGKHITFENPIFVKVTDDDFMVEWKGSGPSGPWRRDLADNYLGIEKGMHIYDSPDPQAITMVLS
jgi:hypothetical protein